MQSHANQQNIAMSYETIKFATIRYSQAIPQKPNVIDVKKLGMTQIKQLAKTLSSTSVRKKCKIAAVYRIKVYLKNGAVRVFRGNNKTVQDGANDFCYSINENFYSNLWENSQAIAIDFSKIVILPFSEFNGNMFSSKREATLSSENIKEAEAILQSQLADKEVRNLDAYFRQYVAVFNAQNHKIIWMNFFCRLPNAKWKKERVVVKDGGNCYWNVKANINTGEVTEFSVNGDS